MTAIEYVEILEQVFLPSIKAIYGDQDGNLQEVINVIEDNSSVHTAGVVQQWYDEQLFFNRLDLPPRSPELNVIENVWAQMVQNWRPSMARAHEELNDRVGQAWEELRDCLEYLQILTDSMPKRLGKIIESGGASIHY